jgi:hypothetical protein
MKVFSRNGAIFIIWYIKFDCVLTIEAEGNLIMNDSRLISLYIGSRSWNYGYKCV